MGSETAAPGATVPARGWGPRGVVVSREAINLLQCIRGVGRGSRAPLGGDGRVHYSWRWPWAPRLGVAMGPIWLGMAVCLRVVGGHGPWAWGHGWGWPCVLEPWHGWGRARTPGFAEGLRALLVPGLSPRLVFAPSTHPVHGIHLQGSKG